MRILHILNHSVPFHDGYAMRSYNIIHNQKALGFEVAVITSLKHEPEISGPVEKIDGVDYYRISPVLESSFMNRIPGMVNLYVLYSLYKRIRKVIRTFKPDVIHAHSPLLTGMAAKGATLSEKTPVVYEIRALWEDAAVDQGRTNEWSAQYRFIRFLETAMVKMATRVVVIAEHLKTELISRQIPESKIFIVPNGIDVGRFKPLEMDKELSRKYKSDGSSIIGFIGSFYHFEGLKFLVNAYAGVKNPEFKLLLVGGGEEEADIHQMVKELHLEDRIILTGRVPHEQVHRYYSIMDIMVYPRLSKRITELVTPLKPLEAMAMGKIVLGSDVGGIKELVSDGQTGYLFKKEDPGDLTAKLETILSHPDHVTSVRKQALEYVNTEKSWQTIVQRYRDIYNF